MNTVEKILDIARGKGFNPAELADLLSTKDYITEDWQRGLREPTIGDIVKISAYFGVSCDYLLKDWIEKPAE